MWGWNRRINHKDMRDVVAKLVSLQKNHATSSGGLAACVADPATFKTANTVNMVIDSTLYADAAASGMAMSTSEGATLATYEAQKQLIVDDGSTVTAVAGEIAANATLAEWPECPSSKVVIGGVVVRASAKTTVLGTQSLASYGSFINFNVPPSGPSAIGASGTE